MLTKIEAFLDSILGFSKHRADRHYHWRHSVFLLGAFIFNGENEEKSSKTT